MVFNIDYKKIKILEVKNKDIMELPIIISIPHSGQVFPKEFLAHTPLSIQELRTSEDPYVDELLSEATKAGITTIKMNVARAFVDVNRDKIELDEQMYFDYPEQEPQVSGSRRSRVGLGVIPRINSENKNIYNTKISFEETSKRIENVYDLYHKELSILVEKCRKKFGCCMIVDAHSMPSKVCNIMEETKQVDFCISNLFEQSAPAEYYEDIAKNLRDYGYRVEFNRPYSGGFITFFYCQPRKNIWTTQIEINRGLYIDEKTFEKKTTVETLAKQLSNTVINLAKLVYEKNK